MSTRPSQRPTVVDVPRPKRTLEYGEPRPERRPSSQRIAVSAYIRETFEALDRIRETRGDQ